MQVAQLRILGREELKGISEAERESAESDILLSHVSGMSRVDLLSKPDVILSNEQTKLYLELLARRKKHEPIAYILGRKEFFGYNFTINSDVLIPRPETELLVEIVLGHLIPLIENSGTFSVIDIGTGSGAIILSLTRMLLDRFGSEIFTLGKFIGVDKSEEALKVAVDNASALDLLPNVLFGPSDLLAVFKDNFAKLNRPIFFVANLPYVPDNEILPDDVAQFEPHVALHGGPDGLLIIRRLIAQWSELSIKNEPLFLEVGVNQAGKISEEFSDRFSVNISTDLAGIERVVELRVS